MKLNFKIKKKISSILFLIVVTSSFFVYNVFAKPDVTITPISGGNTISIDTTSGGGTGTFTALTNPIITENAAGDISTGTHILTLPAGWEFNTAQNVTISLAEGDNIVLNSLTITPLAHSITFTVDTASSEGNTAVLTFSGIQVRPTGTIPSGVSITHSGTGTIAGVINGTTSFGTLTSVVGAVNKITFTTQPSSSAVQNVAFTLQPIVASKDQFDNTRNSDTFTITLSAYTDSGCTTPAGGTLGGTLTKNEVAGIANFAGKGINYNTAETIYLKASDGTRTKCSNNIIVSASITNATATLASPIAGEPGADATVAGEANYTHTSTVWSGKAGENFVTVKLLSQSLLLLVNQDMFLLVS